MVQRLEESWMRTNTTFDFPLFDEIVGSKRLSQLRRRWDLAVASLLEDGMRLEGARAMVSDAWFHRIVNQHTKSERAYHTLVHLEEMFGYLEIVLPIMASEGLIGVFEGGQTHAAVVLSVFFHDVVYNPQSSTNEEDSAALFQEFSLELWSGKENASGSALAGGDNGMKSCREVASKGEKNNAVYSSVVRYILATKSHSVQDSDRNDPTLLAFLDADMSVLAKSPDAYDVYAGLIRKEYQHVPRDIYCAKRAEILEGFLAQGDVFVGTAMSNLQVQARNNLLREVGQLKKGIIPSEH